MIVLLLILILLAMFPFGRAVIVGAVWLLLALLASAFFGAIFNC